VFDAGRVIVFPTTLPVNCVVVAVDVPPSRAYVTVLDAAVHCAKSVISELGVIAVVAE
jgi:hypothetical protein